MVEHGIGTQKAHHTIETFCGKALEERIFLAGGTDTVDNIATFVVLVHHRVNRINVILQIRVHGNNHIGKVFGSHKTG